MANREKKVKRKKYFLINSSQPGLYIRILILFILALLITAWAFYIAANREIEREWFKAHSTLQYVSQMFLPWLIMANIAGIVIVAALLIFFTHKISGASFRIRKDLEMIRKGHLSRKIKLRKKDHLQDVADALNLTFEELRGKIERAAASTTDIEMKVNTTLYYLGEGGDKERARDEAAKLVSDVRRLKDDLQAFVQ